MENVVYHGVAMGGKLYSLRMARRLTQEQLAAVLNISPAAVSKWENNLSIPSIEMLWALADYYDCSIDELVGRSLAQVERVGVYDDEKFRLILVGEELSKCAEIARAKGLLALEEAVAQFTGGSRFLKFAVSFVLDAFMRQMDLELSFRLLTNYAATLPEAEQREGHMIAEGLKVIVAGERPEILQEVAASYIGVEYREKRGYRKEMMKYTRQELIHKYKDKEIYSEATNLLEEFVRLGDFEIQVILRNLESSTLTAALAGASGAVVTAFFSNLSDRILYFISEDMERWQGTEEEILEAQRKILEIGSFCLNRKADELPED